MLGHFSDSIIPKREAFGARLAAIMNYSLQLNFRLFPLLMILKIVPKCRFENYHLTQAFAKIRTTDIEEQLVTTFLSVGRFNDAFLCMPSAPSSRLLETIAFNSKFYAFLPSHCIRNLFQQNSELAYRNRNSFFAFFGITRFED